MELVEESVLSARENAVRNAITNVDFIARDALEYMKENKGAFDTVILDPPRTGAHPKVMKALEEMAPPKIVYMSCNPTTFKDNLALIRHTRSSRSRRMICSRRRRMSRRLRC